MTVADHVFVAAALLHQENPSRNGFKGSELLARVRELGNGKLLESTVNAHIYLHCVGGKAAKPAAHRILHRNIDGSFRLFREGDPYHPDRKNGRMAPDAQELPAEHRPLVNWYWSVYSREKPSRPEGDAFYELRGLGKDLWRRLGGEKFIEALRAEPLEAGGPGRAADGVRFPQVWGRVKRLAGQTFRSARGLPFTYEIVGDAGLRVNRGGRHINRVLTRKQLEAAWTRSPLRAPSELQDLQGPSYLFGILTDPRIS